jgi:hypothetical protein
VVLTTPQEVLEDGFSFANLSCTIKLVPDMIKINKITHMKTCTQIKKTHMWHVKSEIQSTTKHKHVFLMCFGISKHER